MGQEEMKIYMASQVEAMKESLSKGEIQTEMEWITLGYAEKFRNNYKKGEE